MKDLTEGMILKGTVRNVIDFGVFVDIGVHQDGLVHISQITDKKIYQASIGSGKCRRYCRCKSDECGCEEKTNSVDDERNIKMFSYETIQLFNDLELVIYNYIMKNSSQVQYMTIRELADAVHVSTSSIMRFCKKAGCDGYAEFRVKFKLYLESRKEIQPQNDLSELLHYFQGVHTSAFEEQISRAVDMVRGAQQVILIGVGSSGTLARYGARYFSNVGKFSQYIDDPYYPISRDTYIDTVVIALSESGETRQTIEMTESFKRHQCKILSITNKDSSTLSKISDMNLSYFVTERFVEGRYNVTSQVPVLFLMETIARTLVYQDAQDVPDL